MRSALLTFFKEITKRVLKTHISDDADWSGAGKHWHNYSSPFRPSKTDVKTYLGLAESLNEFSKVLILGSTPEIRNIFCTNEVNVVVVDSSETIYRSMLRFAKQIDLQGERFVQADWLNLNEIFAKESFDCIFGDLVLRNISGVDQHLFLSIMAGLLKRNGHFVTRIHYVNENIFKLKSNYLIQLSFDEAKCLHPLQIEDLIVSRLFDRHTDFAKKNIKRYAVETDIKEYIKNNARNIQEKTILSNVLAKWTGSSRNWTQGTQVEIDRIIDKYFIVQLKTISTDYLDSAYYPVVTLRRQANV